MNEFLNPRAWATNELARLYQARINYVPYQVIAQQLGRTAAECEAKWNDDEGWQAKLGFSVPVAVTAEREEEKAALIDKLDRQYDSRLHVSKLKADVWADRIVEAIRPWNEVPAPRLWQPRTETGEEQAEEEMALVLSDLHVGLAFSQEETGGLGEYGLKTFLRRMQNMTLGVRDIRELHTRMYRIPVLNVFCIGDVTHGMNAVGKWSAAYMDLSITDQCAAGVHALGESLAYFLSMFEEVRFWGVSGNHGRTADKGVQKEHDNWDHLAYQMLEAKFAHNPRIKFYCPKSWWAYPTIKNHKFLLMHGEDVKGGNYPVKSLANVESKIAGIMRDHPDYTIIGHFHTASELSTNHGELFVNGSFVGPDMHSLKAIQAGGKPTQKLFGISEKHGVTWRYNLDLDAERRPD